MKHSHFVLMPRQKWLSNKCEHNSEPSDSKIENRVSKAKNLYYEIIETSNILDLLQSNSLP